MYRACAYWCVRNLRWLASAHVKSCSTMNTGTYALQLGSWEGFIPLLGTLTSPALRYPKTLSDPSMPSIRLATDLLCTVMSTNAHSRRPASAPPSSTWTSSFCSVWKACPAMESAQKNDSTNMGQVFFFCSFSKMATSLDLLTSSASIKESSKTRFWIPSPSPSPSWPIEWISSWFNLDNPPSNDRLDPRTAMVLLKGRHCKGRKAEVSKRRNETRIIWNG